MLPVQGRPYSRRQAPIARVWAAPDHLNPRSYSLQSIRPWLHRPPKARTRSRNKRRGQWWATALRRRNHRADNQILPLLGVYLSWRRWPNDGQCTP